MKQLCLSLAIVLIGSSVRSQTLTAAVHTPSAGDISNVKNFDSVGVVPKTTGTGLTWNFSAFPGTTVTSSSSYSTPGSIPASTNFPGSTVVEVKSGGDATFWKSTASPTPQLEMLGVANPTSNFAITFTDNPMIVAQWPVAFGYSVTDVATGTAALSPTLTGTANMTLTQEATGTGTINVPGGASYSVLQTRNRTHMLLAFPIATMSVRGTEYSYFTAVNKFPMITVSYETNTTTPVIGTPTITKTAEIKMNTAFITSINDRNFDNSLSLFPNPAAGGFFVELDNPKTENAVIEIFNINGQLVKRTETSGEPHLNIRVDIRELDPGMYNITVKLGDRKSNRKLIVE